MNDPEVVKRIQSQYYGQRALEPEAVMGSVLLKTLFLKISQISLENTCARVYFLLNITCGCF